METTTQPTNQSRPTPAPKKRRMRLKLSYLFLGVLVLSLGITSFIFYKKYTDLKRDPQIVANQQTQDLVNAVGDHIQLPKDETPTVATVEDKNKLKDQPFFSSVENGDKILIYTKARKAIVYRPSSDKVINVGPIAINDQNNQNIKAGTDQ